ncbi:MAG: CPBP family intramembrane metalloprotease [Ruminococcus sp.]|nr:CPBP family intramembrane metalloprotease [Ruminococcus sp.]
MDTKSLTRRISNINSLTLINFYILDAILLRLTRTIVNNAFKGSSHLTDIMSISAYSVQYLIVVPVCIMLFKFINPDKEIRISDKFRKPEQPIGHIAKWIVMSFGLIYASSYISSFIFVFVQMITKTEFDTVSFAANPTALGAVSNILAMTMLAPFFEELLFRGALLSNGQKIGSWTAVFAVGLSFGLWHGTYNQIIYAAVMGTCAAFLVAKTGSIFSSLALHICINTIGAVQSIFLGQIDLSELEKTLEKGDLSYISEHSGAMAGILIPSALVFVLMIAGIVLFVREIRYHKETFALPESHNDVAVKGKLGAYMTAPITLFAAIGAVTIAVLSAAGII